MATVKFYTKSKTENAVINIRFMQGRKFDIARTTLLSIPNKYWDNKRGCVRSNANWNGKVTFEKRLNNLREQIKDKFNEDYTTGKEINSEWLENLIDDFFDQKTDDLNLKFVSDYSKYHLENLPYKILKNGTTGVQKATAAKYQTSLNKLKEFEKFKKKKYLLSEVNMNFHREFIAYLKEVHHLNYNSIGKYLTIVKTVCLDAYRTKGIKINDAILNGNFRTTKEATNFIVLNETEIDKIFNHNFSNTAYLDNARNWLIIGVWLGARVSDLLKLTSENVKGDYLEYTAKKTGQKIVMPLHWQVSEILTKLNGQFPYKLSSQKFNDYIKIVCEKAGINEEISGSKRIDTKKVDAKGNKIWRKVQDTYFKHQLVSSHICRRSFATNHYGKLPTPVIMSATGHKTEKMLLNYIGKAPKENADVLAQFWKNSKAKRDKKAKMEVFRNAN